MSSQVNQPVLVRMKHFSALSFFFICEPNLIYADEKTLANIARIRQVIFYIFVTVNKSSGKTKIYNALICL